MSTIYAEIYQYIDESYAEYWDEVDFDELDEVDRIVAEYEQAA